ncbi:ankyrin repeat protein [Orbus hercynius]|uniref:Ankyrin repeat protein n=1 Tax=Orbus hercynius TaxID=593135 RepID=A0A495RIY0_9GAMM|nr:ankyrin repeat domain-containing protein [Orbus hercynius]RKS87492.1 ankyrin repeat protein [Orbus hercynius]
MKKLKQSLCILASSALLMSSVNARLLNPNNPEGYTQFRLNLTEMQDIANAKKLSWRIFYQAPSTGVNATWFDAVKQGDIETIKSMVAAGQDIEVKDEGSLGQTALGWAAFIGYEDIFDYLVSEHANLWATDNGDVYNVLKSAVLGKNVNIVKKVHALLPDFDLNDSHYESDGESLVMVAASNNRIDTVSYLISEGVDLNKVTTTDDKNYPSYNQSALSYACMNGYEQMQQLLIEHGAINHRTGHASCE